MGSHSALDRQDNRPDRREGGAEHHEAARVQGGEGGIPRT